MINRTLSKLRPSQPVKLNPRRSKHEVLILSSIIGMPVNCQPPIIFLNLIIHYLVKLVKV